MEIVGTIFPASIADAWGQVKATGCCTGAGIRGGLRVDSQLARRVAGEGVAATEEGTAAETGSEGR